jgi:zinc protease
VKQLGEVHLQAKPRIFLVNRTAAEQSLLFAVEVAPPRADPDNIAFEAVNTVLGGSFISRLNMNLRQDKHWSYGAGSSLIEAKGQRPFVVSSMVQTDKTAESLQETVKELRGLSGARQPTDAEIRAAKDHLVLTLPGSNETAREVAGSYADILTYGLPDTYLNEFVGKVDALSASDLQAASARLIHPDSFTWIIVGDLAAIEAPIRKLGLGEVTVVDSEGTVLR